ncbi:MAG TPA: ribonuclease H-like domain-containing protein, partial [Rectinemataceae bacterium]
MQSLKGRLARIKALGLSRASSLGEKEALRSEPVDLGAARGWAAMPEPGTGNPTRPPLSGWEGLGEYVCARRLETGLILPDRAGEGFRLPFFDPSPSCLSRFGPIAEFGDLSFFDLETTGLSGGVGTIAFLAALGAFEGKNFVLTQVFISDYPGEPAFLDRIADFFSIHPLVVSYNGASFDVPLYRTRRIMNGQELPRFEHLDLLRLARRLWKRRLGSCSLQALENEVLGFEREDDIPSAIIPRLWLEYSSDTSGKDSGWASAETMAKIAEHNAKDATSLASLFLKISALGEDPLGQAEAMRAHASSLSMMLLKGGRTNEAMALLSQAGMEGDQDALLSLAMLKRKMGDSQGFLEAVESLEPRSYRVCILKAKAAEHR